MKYSIVIPTYNHCDDLLKPCIESIFKFSNIEDIELVISANGCKDNTKEYLTELQNNFNNLGLNNNLKVVWYDEPLGYSKACNVGIEASTCDYIVLMNNDVILLEQQKNHWLNLLEHQFIINKKCGISCVHKLFSECANHEFAVFFLVMIHKKVFDKIGLLNTDYGIGAGEDTEFCIESNKAGFETCLACEIFFRPEAQIYSGYFPVYHKGEGTVHDETLVTGWAENFFENSLKLARKYNPEWPVLVEHERKQKSSVENVIFIEESTKNKIGVITPVYNDFQNLVRAINYVKTQGAENVIHYIYDDASKDDLQNYMNNFLHDNSIVYIRGDVNKGQSFGRNTLIEEAIKDNCNIIAFLDSDDKWESNHLNLCIGKLTNNDIVFSTPKFVFENESQAFPDSITIPKKFIGKQLKHNNFIWISSVVAKSVCFKTNQFDSALDSIEDWDMWLRLFEQGYTFEKLESQTAIYTVRNNSQAASGPEKMSAFSSKHNRLDKLKLHLGCGGEYHDDYINIDLYSPEDAKCDFRCDIIKLPYEDNSVDEIKAFHVIEHFSFKEVQSVLSEWYRVLKPGGRLWMETPNLLELSKSFVNGHPSMNIEDWRVSLYIHFFAAADPGPGGTHKFLFTENQMRANLSWAGFNNMNVITPTSKYVTPETMNLFLNVETFK